MKTNTIVIIAVVLAIAGAAYYVFNKYKDNGAVKLFTYNYQF